MPGVLAVYTAADLAAYGPHKCMLDFKQRDGSPMKRPIRRSLASGKVRFVGDPVACVVAETAVAAKDAAEAVELDIEPLPAVALATRRPSLVRRSSTTTFPATVPYSSSTQRMKSKTNGETATRKSSGSSMAKLASRAGSGGRQ